MDNWKRNRHEDEYSDDSPIYSRLFVVYKKTLGKEVLEKEFSPFGKIEDIKIPLDQYGQSKGVCFIKFSKTSEAAKALEAIHGRFLPGTERRIKVLVAVNRSEIEKSDDNDGTEKYKRLFLHIPRNMKEIDIENTFGKYGEIKSVVIQRDHYTGESKGFAYVSFAKFSEAALAFEECERMYRPIFAKPKHQSRAMTSFESNIGALANSSNPSLAMISMMGNANKNNRRMFTAVQFMCCPLLSHWQIGKLFDLIPGMEDCQFFVDNVRNCGKGTVTYSNPNSAAYAVEKLNEFEYPPGMPIYVRPDGTKNMNDKPYTQGVSQAVGNIRNAIASSTSSGTPDLAKLAEAIAEASKIIKMATGCVTDEATANPDDINYCSVKLPPPQPLAHIDSPVAKRCFLVCKPSPPPSSVLRDIFCRFGDLINVYTLPNKTVGYARYASVQAANQAMQALHGAEVCGVRIKVLEAEEEAPPKKRRCDNFTD